MKVCVKGCKPIVIPKELAVPEKGAFSGDTPYVAKLTTRLTKRGYLANKLPAKLLCLSELKKHMIALGGYKTLAEPMAGVGLSVRVLDNGGELYLNDMDEGCRSILELNFGGEPTAQNAQKMELPWADVIFQDFNNFTFKRYLKGAKDIYAKIVDNTFGAAQKFVILNDCSVFYFRYGERSFATYSGYLGTEIHSVEEYFRAVAKFYHKQYPKWHLVQVAYFKDAAFLLFSLEKAKLAIKFIDNPEPIVSVEL